MQTQPQEAPKVDLKYLVLFIALIWLAAIGVWYWARDPEVTSSAGEDVAQAVPTFTLFGIAADTPLDRRLRGDLNQALGDDALFVRTPVDISVLYPGFVEEYFPGLAALNRQLNPEYGQRRQFNTRKLSFRHLRDKDSAITQAHFLFSNHSQLPLWITVRLAAEGQSLIEDLTQKYGPPQGIETADRELTVQYWQRADDQLIIGRRLDGNGRPRFTLELFFVQNLNRFADRETQARRQQQEAREKQARKLM